MTFQRTPAAYRDALFVFVCAALLRTSFTWLIGGTYDYDEFVILLLSRDAAHGAAPYRDFMFFHPPGVLLVFRALEPLISAWWPLARLLSVLADSLTAVLVWTIGKKLFERRTALVAGLLYAASPLALVSAARVSPDPLITLLGFAGLALLVRRGSWPAAVVAGTCLGLAVLVKYPALFFLPVYALAAPRRTPLVATAAAAVFLLCLAPWHADLAAMYDQTVTFQRSRWLMAPDVRLETVAIFWVCANLLGFLGLLLTRRPLWLPAGLLLGGVFALSSQVYYHYFVPVVPFAALLAAPLLARRVRWSPYVLLAPAAAVALAFGLVLDLGGPSPLYVTSAKLSSVQPAVRLLERDTGTHQPVLGDRFEYAFLAARPALAHYFWNVGVLVDASYLESRLHGAGAVVLSFGASSGYPSGFTEYLDARYRSVHTPAASVWVLDRRLAARPRKQRPGATRARS